MADVLQYMIACDVVIERTEGKDVVYDLNPDVELPAEVLPLSDEDRAKEDSLRWQDVHEATAQSIIWLFDPDGEDRLEGKRTSLTRLARELDSDFESVRAGVLNLLDEGDFTTSIDADLVGVDLGTERINGHDHALTSGSTEQLIEVVEPLASRGLRAWVCQEKLQALPDGTGVGSKHQPHDVAGVLSDDTSLTGLSNALPQLVTLGDQQRCHASYPHIKHPTVSFGLQARHRHDVVVDRSRFETRCAASCLTRMRRNHSRATAPRPGERVGDHQVNYHLLDPVTDLLGAMPVPGIRTLGEACTGHGLFEQRLVVENLGVDSEVGITRVRSGRQFAVGNAKVHGLSPDESDGITVRL